MILVLSFEKYLDMLAHSGSHMEQAESVGECSRESRVDTIPMLVKATCIKIFFTRL